jgi:hypothetical protein
MYYGNGRWAEAPHTGDVTKIISQSLSQFDGGFNRYFHNGGVFDQGGTLAPGWNMVHNKTGRPEPLVPGGAGGTNIYVTVSVDDLAKLSKLDDFLKMLDSSRAVARRTARSGGVPA